MNILNVFTVALYGLESRHQNREHLLEERRVKVSLNVLRTAFIMKFWESFLKAIYFIGKITENLLLRIPLIIRTYYSILSSRRPNICLLHTDYLNHRNNEL